MSPSLRGTARALRHAGAVRSLEVLVLQASPLLGVLLAANGAIGDGRRLVLLLAGSVLVTAHVFVFNDWAGQGSDGNDPRRAARHFARQGIRGRDVAAVTVLLLVGGLVLLALVGMPAVLLGAIIAVLGVAYSGSRAPAKGVPVLASALHLLGGAVHFLLGYTLVRPLDGRGLAIALFFGLVFAAGHLNHEVRDHEADGRNRIRTNAVAFGPRRVFVASVIVFSAAYAHLVVLAGCGLLPRPVIVATLLWPLQVVWSLRVLRGGAGFEQARWMQRRYRLLFALVGLVLVASALGPWRHVQRATAAPPAVAAAALSG